MGPIYQGAASVNVWLGEPVVAPTTNFKALLRSPLFSKRTIRTIRCIGSGHWWQEHLRDELRATKDALNNPYAIIDSALHYTVPAWYERVSLLWETSLAI